MRWTRFSVLPRRGQAREEHPDVRCPGGRHRCAHAVRCDVAQHLLSEPDLLEQPHRIEPFELDLQLVFDSRLDAAVRQKPIARGLRRVIDLAHARAVARLRLQLERGLEEVDVQPR